MPYWLSKISRYNLRTHDVVSLLFLLALSIVNLLYRTRVDEWWIIILLNTVVSGGILLLARYYTDASGRSVLSVVRDWYSVGLVVYVFKVIYYMVYPIRGRDFDDVLIRIDYRLFGVNPTEWISQFHHPILTELLQLIYASYFFLFLIAGYELYKYARYREFHYYVLLLVFGFYLSYAGYFMVPAIGPRFTIHDFHAKSDELPGIYLTDSIRELLNRGESIPPDVKNPEDYVQRDVFPSGHAQLMMVLMYAAWLFRLRCRYYMYVIGSLLLISTVYLWYHYVIDVIAAVPFFGVTVGLATVLDRLWLSLSGGENKKGRTAGSPS
jgi:membrane-associated phospholipid phosphatase